MPSIRANSAVLRASGDYTIVLFGFAHLCDEHASFLASLGVMLSVDYMIVLLGFDRLCELIEVFRQVESNGFGGLHASLVRFVHL